MKIPYWFRRDTTAEDDKVFVGEIDATYTQADRDNALPGRMPFPGSNVEVVAHRQGDDLIILVNKSVCVFRTRLGGAFRDDLNLTQCNAFMRDERIVLGEIPAEVEELAKKLTR